MDKNDNMVSSINALKPEILAKLKIERKFEIFVEEFDEDPPPGKWRPVKNSPELGGTGGNPVISVMSQQDLTEKMNFYKQLGQRFRIIREIDPPSQSDLYNAAVEQGLIDKNSETPVENSNISNDLAHETNIENINSHVELKKNNNSRNAENKTITYSKPKIVTIGDIQIKYDGDKVYQRQWVKLNSIESANFRIINDSNNKLVSMNGKHIEAKRWVLVETSDDDNIGDLENV